MLTNLSINNFAIVKNLYLDLHQGMTTITGETGAGKSIAIDALSLCLGARADSHMVRHNEDKADIIATFSLEQNQAAINWLNDNELTNDDDAMECLIRRVITHEGRSKAFINARPVPLAQLKSLGQYLVNIHGQHAHHLLMKTDHQLSLLDQYAGHSELLKNTKSSFKAWKDQQKQLDALRENSQENLAKKQLLEYQVQELDELNLQEEEFEQLENEHKMLSSHAEISELGQQSLEILSDSEQGNALSLLNSAHQSLLSLVEFDQTLAHVPSLINDALIQIEEAQSDVRHYLDNLDIDPEKIAETEARFSQVMAIAKKHHVLPEDLFSHHQALKAEIDSLDCSDEKFEALETSIEQAKQLFVGYADALTESRETFAEELNTLITKSMHELSMEKAQFKIEITSCAEQATSLGINQVQFLVSANPGQPLQPIAKVASGGELSRISLAIQVITAQKVQTPSLIFDEVDVGISGPTARVVGKMLRQLGQSTQVLCVTHSPQVAGSGHQQLFVAKQAVDNSTETRILQLSTEQRVDELARLLGGDEITESTKENAREMLMIA